MPFQKEKPTKIIAVKERSAGNDTVGDQWIETKSFDLDTPLEKVLLWAGDYKGRLMISYDQ